MREFRSKLLELETDDFEEIAADVARERARRNAKPPAEMTEAQFTRWADEQIALGKQSKAEEHANE
jgi:hypothetical protein